MRRAAFTLERRLWRKGLVAVAGVDEVGRGAWAGPLLAAAVIFPPKAKLTFSLYDSKKLTPKRRFELSELIKEKSLAFSFGRVEVPLIEECGIAYANECAMTRALKGLSSDPDFVLVDYYGVRSFPEERQEAIIKGDQYSASIAAASILAKVERDSQMVELDSAYPGYGFASHKGYGTKVHRESIKRLGPSEVHRLSFVPKELAKRWAV
jgi:ribonuclease HII